ncbi:hypothetical protein E4U43_000882 [Claviceps pusilla]|uniref:Uncharacterized protein n=1 Tax=Claviceps pusilla TaxID=123648 RepID=A0A9P7N988_9HYPO|nr:hypothetical protein E4U43_000882 [Claviceps pusilla]
MGRAPGSSRKKFQNCLDAIATLHLARRHYDTNRRSRDEAERTPRASSRLRLQQLSPHTGLKKKCTLFAIPRPVPDETRYLRILTSSAFYDARSGHLVIPNFMLWDGIGNR